MTAVHVDLTRVDYADPNAPVQGPPTAGMVLLMVLTYSELNSLRSRLETARADFMVLREEAEYGSDWYADLDTLWSEIGDVIAETHRVAPAIIEADHARSVAKIGLL